MESTNSNAAAIRAFRILTVVSDHDEGCGLVEIAQALDLPKQTVHRLIKQLELSGLLVRLPGSKRLFLGRPVHQLAIRSLTHGPSRQVRHGILKALVDEIGETCNLTALVDSDVLYLDRVETAAPLRFYLHPGSRVPAHCSATGKLFLSQMTASQRRRLLAAVPLEKFTQNTYTSFDALEQEIGQVRDQGYAFDNEEFLPGLFCLGVLVPAPQGHSNMGLAVQAPSIRFTRERAMSILPTLRCAAEAIGRINDEISPGTPDDD